MNRKKVCVIGAGPAGLAAMRHLKSSPSLDGLCFEQNDRVGGIWPYTPEIGEQVHSAMYKDMRTNLPKQLMAFSWDFPFNVDGPQSYVSHEDVNRYLQEFADFFQFRESIRLNSRVINVKQIEDSKKMLEGEGSWSSSTKWEVTILNLPTETTETMDFDSVIVCNGGLGAKHHLKPLIPEILNITQFEGLIIHSKDYRTRDIFTDKRVLVFGCGPSGTDIALEIVTVAKEVVMSLRTPPHISPMPDKIRQVAAIKMATRTGFKFLDGAECDADILLLCTGYVYDFPFLDKSCEVQVTSEGKEVTPLYKHMIHTKHPSLCFFGLSFIAVIFYMLDLQARYYTKYLEGHLKLPSEQEMTAEVNEERLLRAQMGQSPKQRHQLGSFQHKYYSELAKGAGCPDEFKAIFVKIYDRTAQRRNYFAAFYKDDTVEILNENSYTYREFDGDHNCSGAVEHFSVDSE